MKNHEVLQQSAQLLLEQTSLLHQLEKCGRITITGSYSYNLMVEPDIDIEVYCENPSQAATSFAQTQISSGTWNGVLYYDWQQWRREDFPQGYYVGLKRGFEDRRWKVDIWFVLEGREIRNTDTLLANISPGQRNLILEAKTARLKDAWPCTSTDIYKAVIEKQCQSVAEIKKTTLPPA